MQSQYNDAFARTWSSALGEDAIIELFILINSTGDSIWLKLTCVCAASYYVFLFWSRFAGPVSSFSTLISD
jgi:hypothetical protein